MAKYKSLLYKEIKCTIRQYGFMALMMIMMIAVCCLGIYVNLEEPLEDIIVMAYFMTYSLAVISGCAFSLETEADRMDKVSGFSVYALALPVKAVDRAVVSYFVRIIAIIAGFIFTLIGKTLIGIAANTGLDSSFYFAYFMVVCIGLFISVCLKGIEFFIKVPNTAKKILTIVCIVIGVIFFIRLSGNANLQAVLSDDSGLEIPILLNQAVTNGITKYGLLVYLFMIVFMGCGIFLSAKAYGRREP